MQEVNERARIVKAVSAFLSDTPLAADAYERALLERFVVGELTIYQVLELLAERENQSDTQVSDNDPKITQNKP